MEIRSLKSIAKACHGERLAGNADAQIGRICTDSRKAQPGDLFFALKGDRFDGHQYLAEVAERGATAVVICRDQANLAAHLPGNPAVIGVDNPRKALNALAARYRQDFRLAVFAVAGSNGKTTTKELVASVLRQRFNTLWSEASFNNDIGVPLTLMRLNRQHQVGVFETGTNHPGELAPLVRMLKPQYGVLTNIGREHLEFFGDVAGVAREEGWLPQLLPSFGILFVNGDDQWTPSLVRRTQASVVTVGLGPDNHWRALNIRVGEEGVTFDVQTARAEYSGAYAIRLLGRHQVSNALLALAAGTELGVTPEEARRGLAECKPLSQRMQFRRVNGVGLLSDAYNANADSMRAALQTLKDLPCQGRRWAVLGDMAELGEQAGPAHREVGEWAAEIGLDRLVAVGPLAQETAKASRAAGLKDVVECPDLPSAVDAIRSQVKPGDLVLIKASRAMGLDRLTECLGRD